MTGPAHVIARGTGAAGEIALRSRTDDGDDVYELIVNGVFAMDTAETSTERLLAETILERHRAPSRLLVGGLGLGFTAATLLADDRVRHVDVVELEPLLVDWLHAGLVPPVKDVLSDRRLDIIVADVAETVTDAPNGAYDGLLLDVDNGPEFLVHPSNAALYELPFLAECRRVLASGGLLGIWLAAPSPRLRDAMSTVFGNVETVIRAVEREGRQIDYVVYLTRAT